MRGGGEEVREVGGREWGRGGKGGKAGEGERSVVGGKEEDGFWSRLQAEVRGYQKRVVVGVGVWGVGCGGTSIGSVGSASQRANLAAHSRFI